MSHGVRRFWMTTAKRLNRCEPAKNCLAHELTQCTEDEGHYILRLEWDSEEGHLKGFRSSVEFKSFFALVRPYVNDIEEMRHYRLTDVRGRKE